MDNNMVFSISTQMVLEGRELKSVEPDSEGVYRGIPLTAIGINSRNNVNYDPRSVVRCITTVTNRFNVNLVEGNLEGEWGHPLVTKKEELPRLLYIDRTRISHYFRHVYAKKSASGDYIIVYGDLVAFGPYGQYLRESFADKKRNTCFSLRSAAKVTGTDGPITYKEMLALVTFDAVDGPGFAIAGKRNSDIDAVQSMEAIDIPADREDLKASMEALKLSGVESIITDNQLLDIFQSNQIRIRENVVAVYDEKAHALITPKGRSSLFGTCFDPSK